MPIRQDPTAYCGKQSLAARGIPGLLMADDLLYAPLGLETVMGDAPNWEACLPGKGNVAGGFGHMYQPFDSFTGAHLPDSPQSPAEYMTLYNTGWEPGARRMQASLDRLAIGQDIQVMGVRRRRAWRDEGDELDYDRFRAGQLDIAWAKPVKQTARHSRVVDVGIEFCVNWHVDPLELHHTGTFACALTDVLEAAGYRTRLRLLCYAVSNDRTGKVCVEIDVKHPQEPVQLDRLALAVHPCVFRCGAINVQRALFPMGRGFGYAETGRGVHKTVEELSAALGSDYTPPDVICDVVLSEDRIRPAVVSVLERAELHELALAMQK